MTEKDLLENDTVDVINRVNQTRDVSIGLIVLLVFVSMILAISLSIKQSEINSMRSKIDTLTVAKQSLENNLLAPKTIDNRIE